MSAARLFAQVDREPLCTGIAFGGRDGNAAKRRRLARHPYWAASHPSSLPLSPRRRLSWCGSARWTTLSSPPLPHFRQVPTTNEANLAS